MLAKVSNDFSPPIRKDSCRLSSCVNVFLHCVIANRHLVLSCRRLPTRLMIASHSCAWQRLSQHSLHACASRRKRLVSLNARKSCDSWLKTFWLARISSPFVTAFRSLQVCPKTEDPKAQTAKITFCVSGVTTPPCGVPRVRSIVVPSSCTIGAFSHLSMYSSAHLHFTCFRMARSKSSWSMLSNRPLMSNSSTQSYFQHRSRVTPTASRADFLGR